MNSFPSLQLIRPVTAFCFTAASYPQPSLMLPVSSVHVYRSIAGNWLIIMPIWVGDGRLIVARARVCLCMRACLCVRACVRVCVCVCVFQFRDCGIYNNGFLWVMDYLGGNSSGRLTPLKWHWRNVCKCYIFLPARFRYLSLQILFSKLSLSALHQVSNPFCKMSFHYKLCAGR